MLPLGEGNTCPHCGHNMEEEMSIPVHVLRPGTVLQKRYLLGLPLGQGGFGITYIGRDLLLDMRVAVKEFFPNGYANRYVEASEEVTVTDAGQEDYIRSGKERFLREAKVLAQFHGNPSIVDVRDFFEGNNTAYIVMEYIEGEDLRNHIKKRLFSADEIFSLLDPIFLVLDRIHEKGIIHRDISPDNIMMQKDGTLKLMDFGAARLSNVNDHRSVSVVLKAGYAPEEQYRTKGIQGPWTDIYALCATIYKCITGITPDDSMERVFEDSLKWPSEMGIAITEKQEAVLKKGLSVRAQDRYQSLKELREDLFEGVGGESSFVSGAELASSTDVSANSLADEDDRTIYDPSAFSEEKEKTIYDPAMAEEPEVSHDTQNEVSPIVKEEGRKRDKGNKKEKGKKKIDIKTIIAVGLCLVLLSLGYLARLTGSSQVTGAMLLGEMYNSSLTFNGKTSFTEVYSSSYQNITVDGEQYEISLFPAYVETTPEKMTMCYYDRLGNIHEVYGTYKIKGENLILTVLGINGEEAVVKPNKMQYKVKLSYTHCIEIEKNGKSVFLDSNTLYRTDQDGYIKDTKFLLKGTLSPGSEPYNSNIVKVYITCWGGVIWFKDGGYAVLDEPKITDDWVQINWHSEIHPYNGETIEENKAGYYSPYYIINRGYGFVLIDSEGVAHYFQEQDWTSEDRNVLATVSLY